MTNPFADVDDAFIDGLKDDYLIFDGKETVLVEHNINDTSDDFDTGKSQSSIERTEVKNCLWRQPSLRNGSSVPELHERSMAVQKDNMIKYDVVLEVPILEGLLISDEDSIVRKLDDSKWRVVMVDIATLKNRYRLGLSRFR